MNYDGGLYLFNFPTPIHFGVGAKKQIPTLLQAEGIKRPLIVTDKGLAGLPLIQTIQDLIRQGGMEPTLYSGVWGNPVKSQVDAGTQAYRDANCDAIVMVGGGAAMDVAKTIALMASHPGDVFDYIDGDPNAKPTPNAFPYQMAIPTTAGTGSEVGRSSVISDDETHAKKIIFTPKMLPNCVISEPEFTLNLPEKITATTGLDALTHLVEAYVAKGYHPICDGIALEGIRLVAANLEKVVEFSRSPQNTPEQLAARAEMLLAAHMGATAFQKGLGVTHSLAHSLSTNCDMHHGLANGIMIPYAMEFNHSAVPERFETMAAVAGQKDFIAWLKELNASVGIPTKLSDEGVQTSQVDALVEVAFDDICHQNNPRPVSKDDFRKLYEVAL